MLRTMNVQTRWPSNNLLKRKTPGIAVIGRSWANVKLERLSYLIGNIFNDLPIDRSVMGFTVAYLENYESKVTCTVTLMEIIIKPIALHAVEWQHLRHFSNAFISLNSRKEVIPMQYIECDRCGMYWQLPYIMAIK